MSTLLCFTGYHPETTLSIELAVEAAKKIPDLSCANKKKLKNKKTKTMIFISRSFELTRYINRRAFLHLFPLQICHTHWLTLIELHCNLIDPGVSRLYMGMGDAHLARSGSRLAFDLKLLRHAYRILNNKLIEVKLFSEHYVMLGPTKVIHEWPYCLTLADCRGRWLQCSRASSLLNLQAWAPPEIFPGRAHQFFSTNLV